MQWMLIDGQFTRVENGKFSKELIFNKLETSAPASDLPLAIATLRVWHGFIATVSRRFLSHVLAQFDGHLRNEAKTMKDSLPTVSACFSNKQFSEQVANHVLARTVGAAIQAHNNLHKVMAKVAEAGVGLRITTALDEHEATTSAIAMARAAFQ